MTLESENGRRRQGRSRLEWEGLTRAMPNFGARWRWPGILAIVTALIAGGVVWSWLRQPADPLAGATAAYSRGDWEEAARLARVRLKSAADDPAALRLVARASVRLGRTSAALAVFNRLGSREMMPEDLYLLGLALKSDGNDTQAVKVWEQARAADPAHADTLLKLTLAYTASGRLLAASETGRVLASRPGWEARAESMLGAIAFELNNPSGAVTHWQRALGREVKELGNDSMAAVLRQELARALLQATRPVEARTFLQSLLADGPNPERYWLLSRAYLQEGKTTEALAAWKQAGSFRDDNPLLPEPARYVGSAACAQCHRATFQAQQSSRHARTYFGASDLGGLDLPASTFIEPGQPKVSHTLRRVGGNRLEQETHAAGRVFHAVVEYAFGSGDRGLTLVGRDEDGQARELRLSHYHGETGSSWDVTAGHPVHPSNVLENLGQPLTADAVRGCFLCHVTNPQAVAEGSGPGANDHGIGCEKCHGPGGNHLLAVADKFPDLAIARPTLSTGAPIVNLCAQCHSPLGKTVSRDDPSAVRFQAATLTWSRCFSESNEMLDCTTCHDPHRNVSRSTDDYESKCRSCHGGQERSAASPEQRPRSSVGASVKRAVCPVNPTAGCIGCHMPVVKDVVPHSTFTDHFIRVHRD